MEYRGSMGLLDLNSSNPDESGDMAPGHPNAGTRKAIRPRLWCFALNPNPAALWAGLQHLQSLKDQRGVRGPHLNRTPKLDTMNARGSRLSLPR